MMQKHHSLVEETMRGGSLMKYARNVYSQNGEDGVIAEVFARLGITRGSFVEFGAGNGRDLSNTLRLAERRWCGVWIEADMQSAALAAEQARRFGDRVEVLHMMVELEGDNRLDAILARTKNFALQPATCTFGIGGTPLDTKVVPNIDFMSIDIDSHDLAVWQSLRLYRPNVVLIEINSSIPVGVEHVHGGDKQGNSFTSTLQVAKQMGYTLVCHTGNLLFVDNLLAPKLNLPASEIEKPETIFNPMWVEWAAMAAEAKAKK